jgi:fluoride exporter
MEKTILVGIAGLAGTIIRYWLASLVDNNNGTRLPWGTVTVNLIGCFLTGAFFFIAEEKLVVSATLRTVILIGLFGGFTTFSAYGLQTFTLMRSGELGLAMLNVAISNILGLLLVWAGYGLVKAF